MKYPEVMAELERLGSPQTKQIFQNHGASASCFGVKVGDLKTIVKKVKKNHDLALELFASGNSDAMYLAGLIADPKAMTKEVLQEWVDKANWSMISEYTVSWMAAESLVGWELAMEWIRSDKEQVACAGWSTLSGIVALKKDEELDVETLGRLLDEVGNHIHQAPNRVRYCMNGFIISVGGYVKPLSEKAMQTAAKIGKVNVLQGKTACKVPLATEYIQKMMDMGRIGQKRKTVIC